MPPRLKKDEPIYILTKEGSFMSIGVIGDCGMTIVATAADVTDDRSVPYGAFLGHSGRLEMKFKLRFIDRLKWLWIFYGESKFVQFCAKFRSKCAKIFGKKQ